MDIAILVSQRASCARGQVGAILVLDNRIVANSYNGSLPGAKHCDHNCNISKPCEKTLHAEQNLIAFCAKNGIPTENTKLYITLAPCKTCAKNLIQAGINEVVYLEEFRDHEGLDMLAKFGVKIRKYE